MPRTDFLKTVWEQNRARLLFTLVLVLMILGMYLYQSQVVDQEMERLTVRKAQLQKELRQRQLTLAETGVPAVVSDQISYDLTKFSNLIPPKQRFADFVGDLFNWAQQAGLTIRQINYQPKIEKDSEYLNYSLSFAVTGEYRQLKKFIHLLENSERILIINKISMSGKPSEDSKARVTLHINLTTYFQEAE